MRGKHGGELRVQSGVVGLLLKRRADELLRFGKLFALDENVGEAGVGGDGFRIFGEYAAIGGLSRIVLTRSLGKIGGEQGVARWFRE